MRRALFAITGLAAGTTLMVVLKGGPGATAGTDVPAGLARDAGTPAGSPGPVPSGEPAPVASGVTRPPASGKPAATRTPAARQAGRTPSATRITTAPAKPPSGPRTVYGSSVRADSYGTVQVQITVSGSRVTAVRATELPFETPTSEQKSGTVRRQYESQGEALAWATGQAANLDTVSGATATSTAYRRSLQAALDQV